MSSFVKTNVPNLVKDKQTGVVINTNEYVKPARVRPDREIITLRNEVGSIKTEIKELKDLLLQIVNGKN